IYNKSYYYAHYYGSRAFTHWYAPKRYSLVLLFSVKKAVDRSWAYFAGQDSLVEFDDRGWYGTDTQRDLAENAANAGPFHDRYYDEGLQKTNLNRLQAMIELCQNRDIEPVLVSLPMWVGYRQHTQPERWAYMHQTTDSLAQAMGVPYLDFTEDARFTDEDFFDANHLRRQGAIRFTQILQDTLGIAGPPQADK
ncbi:MAG: hypothetical protein D6722_26235, partial [Bacteroidetes bacterium]